MRKKDLYLIIGVGVIAAIFSFILSSAVFGSPKNHPIEVPVVTPITSSFPSVSTDQTYQAFFNNQSINPTQLIRIGGQTNPQPFTGQ